MVTCNFAYQGKTYLIHSRQLRLSFVNSIPRDFHQADVLEGYQTVKTSSQVLDGIKVLLVEDEHDIAELLTFILEDAGAEVLAVVYAFRALALLEQYQPHLLLCNIRLPDEDGLSLIAKVRTREAEQGEKVHQRYCCVVLRKGDQ